MSFLWQSFERGDGSRMNPVSLYRIDVSFQRKAILRILRLYMGCLFDVSVPGRGVSFKVQTIKLCTEKKKKRQRKKERKNERTSELTKKPCGILLHFKSGI